jgi:hypothetical protein
MYIYNIYAIYGVQGWSLQQRGLRAEGFCREHEIMFCIQQVVRCCLLSALLGHHVLCSSQALLVLLSATMQLVYSSNANCFNAVSNNASCLQRNMRAFHIWIFFWHRRSQQSQSELYMLVGPWQNGGNHHRWAAGTEGQAVPRAARAGAAQASPIILAPQGPMGKQSPGNPEACRGESKWWLILQNISSFECGHGAAVKRQTGTKPAV